MGSNWRTTTLADISERIGDGLHGTPKYSDDGEYYFVNGNNLESGAIVYKDSTKRVGLEEYNKHKKELGSSTVLVSINGTIGNVALYNGEEVVLGKSACYINLKKGISKEFVKYILSGYLFQEYIQRCSTGSTIKNVSLKMMRDFAFRIPDTEIEQDKAVELLKLLDHKISLNNQTNQTLEQMAQALFKSWFVDFDPVFDNLLASVDFNLDNLDTSLPEELKQKAQRRLAALNSLHNAAECKASLSALAHELQAQLPTKEATQAAVQAAETPVKSKFNANPNILAQHANTHAHFPSEFEHNEQLGWIPKGWTSSTTGEQFTFKNGYAFKSKQLIKEEGIPVFKMGHIKRGGGFNANGTKSYFPVNLIDEKISAYFIQKGDLLMSMTDMKSNMVILGNTALMPESNKFLLNQRCGLLRKNTKTYLNYPYMYYFTNEKSVVEELRSRANSGVQVNLTTTSIKETTLLVPSKSAHDVFDVQVLSYLEKMFANDSSISELTKLRDTLLPKLISGELQIPDVATDEEVVD